MVCMFVRNGIMIMIIMIVIAALVEIVVPLVYTIAVI